MDGGVVFVLEGEFFGIFVGLAPLRQVEDDYHQDEGCEEDDGGVFDPGDAGGCHVLLPVLFFEGDAQALQVGDECVHFGFVFEFVLDALNIRLGVGFTQFYFGTDAVFGEGDVCRGFVQPGVGGHIGFGNDAARVGEVFVVPVVAVSAADAGKIRPGAFGAPHEGAVVHGFFGNGVVAVALGFPAEGADHL